MNENGDNQAIGSDEQDGASGVGALLRASRVRVGEDLRDVSDVLCIRYLYLEAIEEGRYADLPGETYAIGFIRSYSEHLGLDGEEVVRRFRAEQAGTKRANDLAFPTPVPESGVPKGALVFVGVIIALLVYGGWYASTTDEDFFSELIAPVPDRLKNLVEETPTASQPLAAVTSSPDPENQQLATPAEIQSTPVEEAEQETSTEGAANDTQASVDSAEETASALDGDQQTEAGTDGAGAETTAVADAPDVTEPSVTSTEPETESIPDAETAQSEVEGVEPSIADAASETPAAAVEADTLGSDEPESTSVAQSEGQEAVDSQGAARSEESQDTTESTVDEAVEQIAANEVPATDPVQEPQQQESDGTVVEAPQETVTAEDLNAQSLRAATGQVVEETAASPTEAVETAAVPEGGPETTGVPGGEVLDESGAVSTTGISIRATTDSWVEITDPDAGSVVFTGLMRAGASFSVPDRGGLLLDTGNAGGLDFFVDGQPVPKIGGDGTVRKGVALNAERLRSGTAIDR